MVTAAVINKVNLTQKLGSIWIQWFRSNDSRPLSHTHSHTHTTTRRRISSSLPATTW